MKRIIFGIVMALFLLGCTAEQKTPVNGEFCIKEGTAEKLSFTEAKDIAAKSDCVKDGTLGEEHWCNEGTGTWWIDLNIEKEGCNPACVINVATKEAEINWMCTGLIIPEGE